MLLSPRVGFEPQVHVHVEGPLGPSEGEPIVLLHAGASSSHQWGPLSARLRVQHRVLAPDLRGEGRTPAPPDWSRMLEDDAAIVASLVDAAGGRAHLVGHSYGGVVAMAVARARPASVRSLALIEPVAFHLLASGGAPQTIVRPVIAARDACVAALAGGEPALAAELFVDYWGGEGSFARLPRPARAAVTAAVGKCAHGWRVLFDEPDTLDDYAALAIPSLVIAGTQSPAPARWIAERLAAALPLGAFAEVAGGGHMSPMTHAAAVNTMLEAHLARHARVRRGARMAATAQGARMHHDLAGAAPTVLADGGE